jgi:hypothetical protein
MPYRRHPRPRRSPVQPLEETPELFPGSFRPYLHIPFGGIPYPAGKAQAEGLVLGGVPEPHPLNPSLKTGEKSGLIPAGSGGRGIRLWPVHGSSSQKDWITAGENPWCFKLRFRG